MRFVAFGARSAARNYQRSALAIASIALVTITLISALSLGLGKPGGASYQRRQFIGGDILIFPEAIATNDMKPYANASWVLHRRSPDEAGLLGSLMPQAIHEGIIVDANRRLDDLMAVARQVENLRGVNRVYPIYELPALMQLENGGTISTTIRARFETLDKEVGFDNRIVSGRYLGPSAGEALIENWTPEIEGKDRAFFAYDRYNGKRIFYQLGEPVLADQALFPEPGQSATIYLPTVKGGGPDSAYFDFGDLRSQSLNVVGAFQIPADTINWGMNTLTAAGILSSGRRFDENHPAHYLQEETHWTTQQIQVSWTTFQQLADEMKLESPEPTGLAVMVSNIGNVELMVESLRDQLGGGTVMSVPNWFETQDNVNDPLIMVPPEDAVGLHSRSGPYAQSLPQSFSLPPVLRTMILVLAYLIGGSLYAANASILLAQRRKELAIMRVLGATGLQVITAIMTELMIMAFMGALIGLLTMVPLMLWHYGTSMSAQSTILTIMWFGLQVLGLGVAVSLLFGGVPAYAAVRQTVGQVIYGDD